MIDPEVWEPEILLVEDDPLTSEQLSDLLRSSCRCLHVAGSAEQGLSLYTETRPDIVITDILMSGMNGLAMARRIRELDPAVPVIVITAYSEMDDFGAAGEIFEDLILKPVDIGELLNAISRCREKILAQ